MNQNSTTELAYVLKATPFQERNLMLILFSETRGKVHALARNGVQSRRFGGCLNLFVASDFEVDAKTVRVNELNEDSLLQILSAQHRRSHEPLSKSFEKLSAASCLNELLIRTLPPHRSAPEVFKLYSNSLLALESLDETQPNGGSPLSLVNAFILKLTQWLGLQPSLTRCLHCKKGLNEVSGNGVFAQVQQGSWLCSSCNSGETGHFLSKILVLDAFHSMLHPIRKIEFEAPVSDHETLLGFLEEHLMFHVPGLDRNPLSTTRFLKSSAQFKF